MLRLCEKQTLSGWLPVQAGTRIISRGIPADISLTACRLLTTISDKVFETFGRTFGANLVHHILSCAPRSLSDVESEGAYIWKTSQYTSGCEHSHKRRCPALSIFAHMYIRYLLIWLANALPIRIKRIPFSNRFSTLSWSLPRCYNLCLPYLCPWKAKYCLLFLDSSWSAAFVLLVVIVSQVITLCYLEVGCWCW